MKNRKLDNANGFSEFCSRNKFCSGTLCTPEQEEETLTKLTAMHGDVMS